MALAFRRAAVGDVIDVSGDGLSAPYRSWGPPKKQDRAYRHVLFTVQ